MIRLEFDAIAGPDIRAQGPEDDHRGRAREHVLSDAGTSNDPFFNSLGSLGGIILLSQRRAPND